MKFQHFSDIHLEFYKLKNIPIIEAVADHLILNGDIGYPFSAEYQAFITQVASKFKYVFITSGNHEYYSSNKTCRIMSDIDKQIHSTCEKYTNVFYLQNTNLCFDEDENYIGNLSDISGEKSKIKYIILGCTLWTFIPDEHMGYIETMMNDYLKIYKTYNENWNSFNFNFNKKNKKAFHITANDVNQLYLECFNFIKDSLSQINQINIGISTIIITHHAPSFELVYDTEKLKYAYGSDALSNLGKEKRNLLASVTYWIFGHTHDNMTKTLNIGEEKVICTSNCMGYRMENLKYKMDKIV